MWRCHQALWAYVFRCFCARRSGPTFSYVSRHLTLSLDACAANRFQDKSSTLWAYVFRRCGGSGALALRLCSESPPRYCPSTVARNLSHQEGTGFITCFYKSRAAARRFYHNCLENSCENHNMNGFLQIFKNLKTARR